MKMSDKNIRSQGKSGFSQFLPPKINRDSSPPLRSFLVGVGFSAIAVLSASLGALLAFSLSDTPLKQVNLTPSEEAVFNKEDALTYDALQIPKLSRPVNILVLGIKVLSSDVVGYEGPNLGYHALVNSFEGLSDSMLLLRLDPETDSVSVLSIPRDTKTIVPRRGEVKINEANALGGPALAAESVSLLLGDINIDRYIRINVQGVEKLISALGGLNLYVPQDMKYTDHSQHLYIDLKKGYQHLDGEKASQFLRFRYDALGDVGRVQRQQIFMRALAEQALSPRTILKMPEILSIVRSHLDTNLTTNELIALAGFVAQKNRSDVRMVMLPGDFNQPEEGELSYWLPNHRRITEVMNQHFNQEGNNDLEEREVLPKRLRVAVQTTEENQEKAQEVVQYLQENGYRRAYVATQFSLNPITETKIIAQQGDNLSAARIRADLGVGEVIVESTGVLNSDITIQIGSDIDISQFNKEKPERNYQTVSW